MVSGMGPLDDKYSLVKEGSDKPEKECEDGCIYARDLSPDDEYCFKHNETTGFVQCEVLLYH